jgi:hypothetical protein
LHGWPWSHENRSRWTTSRSCKCKRSCN